MEETVSGLRVRTPRAALTAVGIDELKERRDLLVVVAPCFDHEQVACVRPHHHDHEQTVEIRSDLPPIGDRQLVHEGEFLAQILATDFGIDGHQSDAAPDGSEDEDRAVSNVI